jgi:7-carboxy-7-deazaguanine synthase
MLRLSGVVVTGGEPLLQQRAAARLFQTLNFMRPGLRYEVETNGTIAANVQVADLVHRFVVSPKLDNSGIDRAFRLRPEVLKSFSVHSGSVLKFVVQDEAELAEVEQIVEISGFTPERVWIMPQATDAFKCVSLMQRLADPVLTSSFNLSGRTHILLWENQRGR